MLTTDIFQYALDVSAVPGTPDYVLVTENSAFNPKIDFKTKETDYKCLKNQIERTQSIKTSVEYDIAYEDGQELQTWLALHEDDFDFATSIVRIDTSKGAATVHEAKMAKFLVRPNPIDGAASEDLKHTGVMNMTDQAWTKGTFNMTTMAFTPVVG